MKAVFHLEESDFHHRVDDVLRSLEHKLDTVDADIDVELNEGILTLAFEGGTKIIVNRQTPSREIWVAAKSGGYHFRFNGEEWLDTRSQQPLWELLSAVISEQAGVEIQLL